VQIFDVGEVDGVPYLAMEYLRGEDLRRVEKAARQAGTPLPLGLVLRIIADAAAGLAYAHGVRDAQGKPMGLVHRDVSPQNILVGFDGAVKLIDFGVAKAAGRSQRTASGILKGKYAYMSPEQADGRPLDGRSDLFALGIILWEVLTSRRLFKGENDLETLRLVKECQVPPPSRLNPEVTPELEAIVLRCLMPQVEERFPDAGAMRLALEDYLVRNGLAASAAHLADFLKPLYAARIEREEHPESMDELSESVDLDARSASESRSQHKQVSMRHFAPPARAAERTQRRPVAGVMAVGAATALLLGGSGLLAWQRAQRPAPAVEPAPSLPAPVLAPPPVVPASAPGPTPAPTPPEPPPAVEPVRPALPATVTVKVESVPAGAAVSSGGEVLGNTPLELDLMREGSPRALEFKLAGHEPVTAAVSAQSAPVLRVELPVRREPKRPVGPAPDLGIKTGR